jgi:hypothetical protein
MRANLILDTDQFPKRNNLCQVRSWSAFLFGEHRDSGADDLYDRTLSKLSTIIVISFDDKIEIEIGLKFTMKLKLR